jgi:glutathione S-transferase
MTMDLQLISSVLCPYVHRAAIMLTEKGVPFDTRRIDLKAKPDWFLALSPRGKVPVLVADGVAIFESTVILEFIDETHEPRILPADPFERARQRAWIEVANDLFSAEYKLSTAATIEDRDAARATIASLLTRLETELVGPFFAGSALGIVDLAVAPAFFRYQILERTLRLGLFEDVPRVAAWAERLAARPSVAKSLVDDFDSLYRARYGAAHRVVAVT